MYDDNIYKLCVCMYVMYVCMYIYISKMYICMYVCMYIRMYLPLIYIRAGMDHDNIYKLSYVLTVLKSSIYSVPTSWTQ
jgi:hypothetical protein